MKIQVTSADGTMSNTYTVRVHYEAADDDIRLHDIRLAKCDADGNVIEYMPLTPMFENHLQSFDYVIESKWDLTKEPLKLQAKVKDDTGYNVYSKVIKPSGEEIKNDIVYISENIEHDAKIEVIFTVSAAPLSNREYKVTLFRDKYPLENPRVQ